jgi:hypothetical protein
MAEEGLAQRCSRREVRGAVERERVGGVGQRRRKVCA